MGRDLAASIPEAAEQFRLADEAAGFSLSTLCFEGPDDALRETRNAQPALLAASLAALAALRAAGVPEPCAVAGHSLGEYTALVAADALDPADAIRLVRLRGERMSDAAAETAGSMAAVVGLDDAILLELCARDPGIVVVANFNSPGQAVISGEAASVARVGEAAKAAGAKRVIPLPVSGAFHSPLMASAAKAMSAALAEAAFSMLRIPVYANVTARLVDGPDALPGLLADQIVGSVRWVETIRHMAADGVERFVEVGPGKVLSGLLRRIVAGAELHTVEDRTSLEKTAEALLAGE